MTVEKITRRASPEDAAPAALTDRELKTVGGAMATREMQEMNMSFKLHANPGNLIRLPGVNGS